MRVYRLENPTQTYAWGSADGLSRALGLPNPSGGPLAELWMGAHPKAPSRILLPEGPRGLDEMIRADPLGTLGSPCLERFGPELPFLFKALSAAAPLSIQVHPGKRRAERGFDKEGEAGIAVDAPNRSYRDRNHKPELAVALTGLEALYGFRPLGDIIASLRVLDLATHRRFLDRLEKRPERIEFSVFFYSLMSMPLDARRTALADFPRRAEEIAASARVAEAERPSWLWAARMARLWPDDIGVLSPLLLNYHRLAPGEAIFINAGEPHAYLEGTALEIMANSDNVVRGALTDKHVDIPEFVSVLSFDTGRKPLVAPVPAGEGEEAYPCPVPDFALSRLSTVGGVSRMVEGPEILLCGEGSVVLESDGKPLRLARGDSAFVCASAGTWSASGGGSLWRARANPSLPADPSGADESPRAPVMRVWADGDSLPVELRRVIERRAATEEERAGGPDKAPFRLVYVASRILEIEPPAEFVLVEAGTDAADDRIVELCERGDIAITRDLPLAERLAEKGVSVLNDRGEAFTIETVKERRSIRDEAAELRAQGLAKESPRSKSYGLRELKRFSDAFDRELTKARMARDRQRGRS